MYNTCIFILFVQKLLILELFRYNIFGKKGTGLYSYNPFGAFSLNKSELFIEISRLRNLNLSIMMI